MAIGAKGKALDSNSSSMGLIIAPLLCTCTLPYGRVSALNAQHLHQLLFQLAQHPFRFVVGHLVHARVTQVVEDFLIRQIEQR